MVWYSEFTVYWGYCVILWGVMRKYKTPLTYKPLKERALYQVIRKIFWGKKNPVRVLYEDVWGTTISPCDEVSYISVCLWESLNILGAHYMKKISPK